MTIKDIARECGVGISTVSRVLNNRPDVSSELRGKILAAVKSSGYVPNNSARDLVKSKSDAIGVVVRGTGNLFFSEMLKSVSSEIEKRGYSMVLHYIDSGDDEIKAGAILEREKKLRGLIFLGGRRNYTPAELVSIGVPYVCCSYTNNFGLLGENSFSSVSIDDKKTAYDAVSALIKMGHRRIAALIPAEDDNSISELRYDGYLEALKDNGIEADGKLINVTGGFGMYDAYRGMTELIKSGAEFSAVFSISDTTAIAAIKAMNDSGIKVPEDCSVIAIDGISLSEYTVPTLTTMVQPISSMGKDSVDILADLLESRSGTVHICAEASLRSGGSARKI